MILTHAKHNSPYLAGSFSLSYRVQLKYEDVSHYPWKLKILETTLMSWAQRHTDIAAREGCVCGGILNKFLYGGGPPLNLFYYLFKIFPGFWLAKSTRIIHHNQLLMTKFERILCLTRKWRQKCSLLQVNAPLTEKTWGRGWVVLVVKSKMADTSLVSRVRTTAGTRRSNS